MTATTFSIDVSGYWHLSIAEMWPDGDAPENPTAQDAVDRISDEIKAIGFSRFMDEWGLEGDLRVSVEGRLVYPRHLADR